LSLLTSPQTGLTFPITGPVPQQLIARQLLLSTLAIAAGKLLLGPLIDWCGGILSLQIALLSLAFFLTIIATCQSFAVFGVAWILVDFTFSSCWAACINAVHQAFPEQQWPKQIGSLAAAARTGNAAAFALFASVLHFFEHRMRQAWRPVFAISAASQLVPFMLLLYFGRKAQQQEKAATQDTVVLNSISSNARNSTKNQQRKKTEDPVPIFVVPKEPSKLRASLVTLRREAATIDFWLHLLSRSVLMLFASFLLFVPTLMREVYGTTSAVGAQVGSLYALGCLLAVTAGAPIYAKLCQYKLHKFFAFMTLLLVGATGSSVAQLGHMTGRWTLSARGSMAMLFLWGFSFAIPFYIPPSLYALQRGGKESSATIADVFDIGGFGMLAAFNGYVASIEHSNPSAWIPTFQITTACSLISFVALSLTVLREKREKQQPTNV
jgi:hypothetical protein